MVKLSLGSRSVARGKFQATGKGCIEGLEFDDKNNPLEELITLPRWFEPKVLIELFPELYGTPHKPQKNGNGTGNSPVTGTGNSGNGGNGALPPGNGGVEPVTGTGHNDISRVLKIEQLRRVILTELNLDISISTLEAIIESLERGRSLTYIVKKVLGLEGREFAKGKYILKIIEEFNSNETDF